MSKKQAFFISSNTRIILPFFRLAPVVQKLDSAIHRINRYPADKYYENQIALPSGLWFTSEECYPPFDQLKPVVQKVDSND